MRVPDGLAGKQDAELVVCFTSPKLGTVSAARKLSDIPAAPAEKTP